MNAILVVNVNTVNMSNVVNNIGSHCRTQNSL